MARRKDRPAGPLDPRSAAVLRAIIEEYITTAAPVGSQTLVTRRSLGVSSATVRSVMAELEAAGFLAHPHTSAGRVPTDAGYRLYVESIPHGVPLAPVEQLMIRHQFGQVEFASEQWFRLAASILAGVTHAAGLATAARPKACRVRRVDLVANGSRTASLVLVLAEGPVQQALINLDEPLSQEDLDAAAGVLSVRLAGCSARQVRDRLDELAARHADTPVIHRAALRVARLMEDFDAGVTADIISDGLLNVMEAPEFSRSEQVSRVFRVLQDREFLSGLVREVSRRGDVQVFIGAENPRKEMRDVALVLAPYGRPGRATGVVGVLGPTRMPYPYAISSVRYVSGLMNELVEQLY